MLTLNAPPIHSSWCSADKPQCVDIALRYRTRLWRLQRLLGDRQPLRRLLGERLVIEVTDSKNPDQPAHVMSLGGWDRFLRGVQNWHPDRHGMYRLGRLRFTPGEYLAFVHGVAAGEFYRDFAAP